MHQNAVMKSKCAVLKGLYLCWLLLGGPAFNHSLWLVLPAASCTLSLLLLLPCPLLLGRQLLLAIARDACRQCTVGCLLSPCTVPCCSHPLNFDPRNVVRHHLADAAAPHAMLLHDGPCAGCLSPCERSREQQQANAASQQGKHQRTLAAVRAAKALQRGGEWRTMCTAPCPAPAVNAFCPCQHVTLQRLSRAPRPSPWPLTRCAFCQYRASLRASSARPYMKTDSSTRATPSRKMGLGHCMRAGGQKALSGG